MLPSEYPETHGYPNIREVLHKQVDMQVADLRVLLQLPEAELGLNAGCNLTAGALLCNLISGASVLFFNSGLDALTNHSGRGRRFKGLMERYYPWHPSDAATDAEGADLIWRSARSPLAHVLGVGKDADLFPGWPGEEEPLWLGKTQDGFPDSNAVDRLLDSPERPTWLERSTTIDRHRTGYVISVKILAWGVQRMLRQLFADDEQAARAENTARVLLTPPE